MFVIQAQDGFIPMISGFNTEAYEDEGYVSRDITETGDIIPTPPPQNAGENRAFQIPPTIMTPNMSKISATGTQRRLSWAKMIQKVYEIGPLLCQDPFFHHQV